MKVPMKRIADMHDIMSHVICECVPPEALKQIVTEKNKLPEDQQDSFEVEVKLFIHGQEVTNLERYFTLYQEQYESMVKGEASLLVNNLVNDKFIDIMDKLSEVKQIIDGWTSEINWEMKNPFIK